MCFRDETDNVEMAEDTIDENTSLHASQGNMITLGHRMSHLTDKPRQAISVENLHLESEGATYLAGEFVFFKSGKFTESSTV